MIAGLPLDTWILMAVSTLPGLALVVAAYCIHSGGDRAQGSSAATGDSARPGDPRGAAEGGPEAPQARPDGSGGRG